MPNATQPPLEERTTCGARRAPASAERGCAAASKGKRHESNAPRADAVVVRHQISRERFDGRDQNLQPRRRAVSNFRPAACRKANREDRDGQVRSLGKRRWSAAAAAATKGARHLPCVCSRRGFCCGCSTCLSKRRGSRWRLRGCLLPTARRAGGMSTRRRQRCAFARGCGTRRTVRPHCAPATATGNGQRAVSEVVEEEEEGGQQFVLHTSTRPTPPMAVHHCGQTVTRAMLPRRTAGPRDKHRRGSAGAWERRTRTCCVARVVRWRTRT